MKQVMTVYSGTDKLYILIKLTLKYKSVKKYVTVFRIIAKKQIMGIYLVTAKYL